MARRTTAANWNLNEVSQVFPCGAGTQARQTANTASRLFSVSAAILSHAVKWPNPNCAGPLLEYPKHHLAVVTYLPRKKMPYCSIGKLRAILETSHKLAYIPGKPRLGASWMFRGPARLGGFSEQSDKFQRRKRSPSACFMTCPPTSEMDLVSGISLGQTSTQFCA